jgi:hypothetical protein
MGNRGARPLNCLEMHDDDPAAIAMGLVTRLPGSPGAANV